MFGDLVLAFFAYTTQNILLTGIPVPSGNFTGTMLIGGFVGRALGNLVNVQGPGHNFAKPGVYAMMGSAAMLCGFKRMAMAVVLFISECGNDWSLIPPLAITVYVALGVCKRVSTQIFNKSGFDEEQMLRKGILFIDADPHKSMYVHTAIEFLDRVASQATMSLQETFVDVKCLLEGNKASDIPVVRSSDGMCVGVIARSRLESAIALAEELQANRTPSATSGGRHAGPCRSLLASQLVQNFDFERGILPVSRLMDPAPLTVNEDMPAPRVHALFARAGITYACVVSEKREFKGLITRTSMITYARKLHGE